MLGAFKSAITVIAWAAKDSAIGMMAPVGGTL